MDDVLRKYIVKKDSVNYIYDDYDRNHNEFCKNALIKTRTIKEYYENSSVFITGSTGFLGKVLIEKLLRSCDGVRNIYMLLRPKRGMSSEQRFKEFQKNQVFDRIRNINPELLNKIIFITGDINQPNLGLNETDTKTLIDNVDIVFHVAATVRFNEGLREAANLNAFGTKRVMELCTNIKNLKSVVHVSTAYSNPQLYDVDERVYGSTASDIHQIFVNGVNVLPEEFLDILANRMQFRHPNTYTLTKSIAEQIVVDYNEKFPICIVRPSIVTGAIEEPYVGWVDNVFGITGIVMEIGRGTISSIMGDEKCNMDLIPVDIVCNTLITAAWANSFNHSNDIKVYNCTSGQINPISWKRVGELTCKYGQKNPSKYVMLYPNFTYRTNRLVHFFYEIFFQFLPAILYDIVMRLQGKKPIMFKIAKRFKAAADTGEYFAMHEWNFGTNNFKEIIRAAQATQLDADEFNCDMSKMDWDTYIENFMLGIRQYVLKDDISSLPAARLKVKRLLLIKRILQILLALLFFYILSRFW